MKHNQYKTNMKRAFLTLIVLIAISLTTLAQATQPCIVKQYNQKQQKTPLPGVQVEVRDAGSTASGTDGTLILKFTTLKPGDRVTLRRVAKSGYEIFNKTAVEQWNISRNNTPFVIVLVKSEYFAQLKNNLKQTSVSSYKAKYEQAKASLAKQQKEGKLKEEEYRKKLYDLEEQYDNQLKNIDSYIDVFARFDLSELSEEEERIIEMVHNGQIDEAVKAYDKLKIIEKYESAIESRDKLSKHIGQAMEERDRQQLMADSIFAIMQRQNVTLTEMTLQLKKEEMADKKKYRQFLKSALDTFETLYDKDPDRYRESLDLIRKEWERVNNE